LKAQLAKQIFPSTIVRRRAANDPSGGLTYSSMFTSARSAQGARGSARGLDLARSRKVGPQHYPYPEAFADSPAAPSAVRAHTSTLNCGRRTPEWAVRTFSHASLANETGEEARSR
jgi:hypothetical protein